MKQGFRVNRENSASVVYVADEERLIRLRHIQERVLFAEKITFNPLTSNLKEQILLSCPHTFLKSTGEKLLKYQENSLWVIISLILITSGAK